MLRYWKKTKKPLALEIVETTLAEMAKGGTKYYAPNADELNQWKEKAGAQRPEWSDLKKKLAGSLAKFGEFQEAAETQGQYYVDDVKS